MAQFIQQCLHEVIQLIGMPGIITPTITVGGYSNIDLFFSCLGENPNFGQLMMDKIRRTLILAAALALNCFTDGSTSLERVFLSQLVGY